MNDRAKSEPSAPDADGSEVLVLACLEAGPGAEIAARRAQQLARQLRAPWEAVHVERPTNGYISPAARETQLEAFRTAESLGAKTHALSGDDIAAEILQYAKRRRATHIVVGASSRPRLLEAVFGSIARTLVENSDEIAVEVCRRKTEPVAAFALQVLRPPPLGDPVAYVMSTIFVALATAIAVPIHRTLAPPNVSLVFVLAVIASAVRYGAWVAIFTAALSALAYNFFLTEPYYSFAIADSRDVWAVFFFLIVGFAVSAVTAHTRAQTLIARRQADESEQLQAYARSLVGTEDEAQIAATTVSTISTMLYARVVALTQRHGQLEAIAEAPGSEILGVEDFAAAQWAFDNRRDAGHGAGAHDRARWLFVPVPGERGFTGVIGVRPIDDASRLSPDQRRLLDLILAQAGVALDRARFSREAANARVEAEGERQKRALIASLSHDLRTPLTTIRGAVESVLKYGDKHDEQTRRDLLQDAADEAQKLTGFIQNLLDMMRLDTGAIHVKRERADIAEIIESAIDAAYPALDGKQVSRDIAASLPQLVVDRAMTENALVKVLENAGKYSPQKSTILIRASRDVDAVKIEILDEGPGFPPSVLENMFGRFVRGVDGDGRTPGTGLGLALAKGFIEAQGGTIDANNRTDRPGACMRIVLPIEDSQAPV